MDNPTSGATRALGRETSEIPQTALEFFKTQERNARQKFELEAKRIRDAIKNLRTQEVALRDQLKKPTISLRETADLQQQLERIRTQIVHEEERFPKLSEALDATLKKNREELRKKVGAPKASSTTPRILPFAPDTDVTKQVMAKRVAAEDIPIEVVIENKLVDQPVLTSTTQVPKEKNSTQNPHDFEIEVVLPQKKTPSGEFNVTEIRGSAPPEVASVILQPEETAEIEARRQARVAQEARVPYDVTASVHNRSAVRDAFSATDSVRDRVPRSGVVSEKAYASSTSHEILPPSSESGVHEVRFPDTTIMYRSGDFVRLPGTSEAVQLVRVPEVFLEQASGDQGLRFVFRDEHNRVTERTYFKALEKVKPIDIQNIYQAGAYVSVPTAEGGYAAVKLAGKPELRWIESSSEMAYVYTYERDGQLETKAYMEPLTIVDQGFSPESLANFRPGDEVEITVKGKKFRVTLVEPLRAELNENNVSQIVVTYDAGNGVKGTHLAENIPTMIHASVEARPELLPDLTNDAVVVDEPPYPALEIGNESVSYTFGEYVLYEFEGRWHIGTIQAEPRLAADGRQVEFTVRNARTGQIDRLNSDRALKKFSPLDSKKLRVGGIDYTVEGGHISPTGDIEYQLVGRRNEVIPNVDIETIRNLQEAERVAQEMKVKIRSIELRIDDLATHKVRDLMLAFNELQLKMQSVGGVVGETRSWNTLEPDEISQMSRQIRDFKRRLNKNLLSLESAVQEQVAAFRQQREIDRHAMLLAEIQREMKALGISPAAPKDETYYRKLETIFEAHAKKPGDVLYAEINARWNQLNSILSELGVADEESKRYLLIMEEVVRDWGEEKKGPEINFKQEFSELKTKFEGSIPDEVQGLRARFEALPESKRDAVIAEFDEAEGAFLSVKPDDPKLALKILKAWQAIGKLEVKLAALEGFKKEGIELGRKLDHIELPSNVLLELLRTRPEQARKIVELLYTVAHEFSGTDDTPLAERQVVPREFPEITAALQKIFSADTPQPALLAALRVYGIKDWSSFVEVWSTKYAREVGMAMYDSIGTDILSRAVVEENQSFDVKSGKKLFGFLGKKDQDPSKIETDREKFLRVASVLLRGDLASSVGGERQWLSSQALTKFAAEMAIAVRKVNIELRLSAASSEAERSQIILEELGVKIEDIADALEQRGNNWYLTKGLHELIEGKLKGLEKKLDLSVVRKRAAELGVKSLVASAESQALGEEFIGEKRQTIETLISQTNARLAEVQRTRLRLREAWISSPETAQTMGHLSEAIHVLEELENGSSRDKVLSELARSPAYKALVVDALTAARQYRREFTSAIEAKSRTERLARVEHGLAMVEAAGRTEKTKSKEARQVIGALQKLRGPNLKLALAPVGAALIALTAARGVSPRPKQGSAGSPGSERASIEQRVSVAPRLSERVTIPTLPPIATVDSGRRGGRAEQRSTPIWLQEGLIARLAKIQLPASTPNVAVAFDISRALRGMEANATSALVNLLRPGVGEQAEAAKNNVLQQLVNELYTPGTNTVDVGKLQAKLASLAQHP